MCKKGADKQDAAGRLQSRYSELKKKIWTVPKVFVGHVQEEP